MATDIVITEYKVGKARPWSLSGWFNKKENIWKVVCILLIQY